MLEQLGRYCWFSLWKWNNEQTKDFPLFRDDCFFQSDDTVMTQRREQSWMAVADAMKKYGRMYPNAITVPGLTSGLRPTTVSLYNSFGNGSVMRFSVCLSEATTDELPSVRGNVWRNFQRWRITIQKRWAQWQRWCNLYVPLLGNNPAEVKRRIKERIEKEYGIRTFSKRWN